MAPGRDVASSAALWEVPDTDHVCPAVLPVAGGPRPHTLHRASITWEDGQQQVLPVEAAAQTSASGVRPAKASFVAAAVATAAQQLDLSQLERWLVPDVRSRHTPLAAPAILMVWWGLYCFMAGRYPLYPDSTAGEGTRGWQPASLVPWLVFWGEGSPGFDAGYLYAWGARWAPALAADHHRQAWRLLTSVLIHSGPAHLVGNTVLWLTLAPSLERTYGALRVGAVFWLSALGGSFLSLAAEDPCRLYVGASGGCFGLLGLYVADLLLNFETLVAPLLRLLLLALGVGAALALEFAVQQPAAAGQQRSTSHLSHLGGFLSGSAASFLFLPTLQDKRWRKVRRVFSERLGLHLAPPGAAGAPGGGGGGSLGRRRGGTGAGAAALQVVVSCEAQLPRESCWSRRPLLYWVARAVFGTVAVATLAALPGFVFTQRLPWLACPALPGAAPAVTTPPP